MTIPSDLSGLIGWFDSSYTKHMWSDQGSCGGADDLIYWIEDKVSTTSMLWTTDSDVPGNTPGVTLALIPEFIGGVSGVRFRVSPEEVAGSANTPTTNTMDNMFTAIISGSTPTGTCGPLYFRTVQRFTPPACWTVFSAFNVDSVTTPFPNLSVGGRFTPAPVLAGTFFFGLCMLYSQDNTAPLLAAHNGGSPVGLSGFVSKALPLGPTIAESTRAGNTICLWENGTFIQSKAASSSSGNDTMIVGAGETGAKSSDGTPHGFGDWYLYESLIYNRLLNKFERDQIRAYLSSRWSIPVLADSSSDCEVCSSAQGGPRTSVTLIGAN